MVAVNFTMILVLMLIAVALSFILYTIIGGDASTGIDLIKGIFGGIIK